jgi:hypothetical protein
MSPAEDEDLWQQRFRETRDLIRRRAQEALEEDDRGDTLSLDGLIGVGEHENPKSS